MHTLCSGIKSAHILLNLFSFKIEETYTLTTFVDQKLSLSVYSKSTDVRWFGLAGILRFVKIIEKNIGLPVI